MRRRTIVAGVVLAVVAGTTAGGAAVGIQRSNAYTSQVAALEATWTDFAAKGVPGESLQPLRHELASKGLDTRWWSARWLSADGLDLVGHLHDETDAVWSSAMATAKAAAQASIDEWEVFAQQQTSWITADASATAATWPDRLAQAGTPAQLDGYASSWHAFTAAQRQAVLAAQQAKLNAELASAGGPQAVLATARKLAKTAAADNLDDQGVAALAAQLSTELRTGTDPTQTAQQLLAAVKALQALIDLNNQVAAQIRPLLLSVDQVLAENTPNAAALSSQYHAIAAAFQAARTADALNAVATQLSAAQAAVNAEITANQCGHPVGSGKVITISLSLQEMIFYQDGCAVRATPVTTGRPQLPTPSGRFHIFYKTSPFQMISPWPKSSPFYYNPTWVRWVMEFNSGGYFIHDADWEPVGDYGPGGQNLPWAASHGCVHTPTPVMEWAYSWTPVGTPVIISP